MKYRQRHTGPRHLCDLYKNILAQVNVPVVLISGNNDWLADPKDVAWLRTQLPRVISHKKVVKYNHLDFIWGMSARNKVYKPIIKMMKRHRRLVGTNRIY